MEASTDPEPLTYPETRREDIVETLHGQRVADPYRWLEDAKRDDVQAWMSAQDDLAREYLAGRPGREPLRKRMTELTYVDSVSPPYRRGDRYFYSRSFRDKEKSVHYVRKGNDGPEQVLIDENELSDDGSVALRGFTPSETGRYIAYRLSHNNADNATMYVRDLETGRDSEIDVIEGARFAYAAWTPDDRGFYYVSLPTDADIPVDQIPGHAAIRFHTLGTPPADDPVIEPPTGDPTRFLGVGISEDGHWLLEYVSRGEYNELYVKDLRRRGAKWIALATGFDAAYSVDIYRDRFYVTTNDGAPNQRVFRVDPRRPKREQWEEIVPERDALLQVAYVVGGHLVLDYLRDAHTRLEIHDLDGKLVRNIDLPGLGSASGLVGRKDDDVAYYYYSSYTEPPQIFETSISTGETSLWGKIEYPVDPSRFTAEQVWFSSRDGTRVPMFLVYAKGLERDGSNPTLLTGYGGFASSRTPWFSTYAVAWAEQGGIYAVANLRGGGEYGEPWHAAGMRGHKQNVFDDFIGAAEYLVAEGYTRSDKLAIRGGSNGGLLVGAAMVQRPDLFAAVLCSVPLLDMVRFHEFGTGRIWVPEYGDPDIAEEFAWLYAYSPYHHVEPGTKYPALLMESADSDDRVDPMHARKFVAAVQAAQAGPRPVILRIERNAGHGGSDLRRQWVEEDVDEFVFLRDQLAMGPLEKPPEGSELVPATIPSVRRWILGLACLSCSFESTAGSGGPPVGGTGTADDGGSTTAAVGTGADATGAGDPTGMPGTGDGPPPSDDWDACHRLSFNAPPPAPGLPEFPVLVSLDPQRIDYASVAAGAADLRFLAGGTHAPLPYEIERWAPGGKSTLWVEVTVSNDPGHFWLCYGQAGLTDAQAPADVWSSYRAVWHASLANPATAPEVVDASGQGLHATLSAAAANASAEGRFAGGLEFHGVGYNASVPNSGALAFDTAVSVEGWFRPDALVTPTWTSYLLFKGNSYELMVQRPGANNPAFAVFLGPGARLFVDAPLPVAADGWHYLVGTWHRDEAVGRIYLDGMLWADFDYPSTVTMPLYSSAEPLYLGLDIAGGFDEVRVVPRQLPPEWIALQYRSMTDVLLTYGPAQELD